MQTKTNGKQTLSVLVIALVLIAICTGGLWVYVIGVNNETGILDASAAEIPEEAKDIIAYESYDEYPGSREDVLLNEDELRLLDKMRNAYEQGKRPAKKAPTLPDKTGFAIIPLDPNDYDGMTDYYIIPDRNLTEQEFLQLIAHGEELGVPFTLQTFTTKNCMTYGSTVNRNSPAGENERYLLLFNRFTREGLRPKTIPVLTFPVSGPAKITLNSSANGAKVFYLHPLRELTDEELLQLIYMQFNGNIGLDPRDIGRNAAMDEAWVRAIAEDVLSMPLSVDNNLLIYNRMDSTGNVVMSVNYVTPLINGKRTHYIVAVDLTTNRFSSLSQHMEDRSLQKQNETQSEQQTVPDFPWEDIATSAVEKLSGFSAETMQVYEPYTAETVTSAGSMETAVMPVNITVTNGDKYNVSIRISDGIIEKIHCLSVT